MLLWNVFYNEFLSKLEVREFYKLRHYFYNDFYNDFRIVFIYFCNTYYLLTTVFWAPHLVNSVYLLLLTFIYCIFLEYLFGNKLGINVCYSVNSYLSSLLLFFYFYLTFYYC